MGRELAVLTVGMFLSACATPASVMQSKGQGTEARYALSVEQVRVAVRQVLFWNGVEQIQDIPEQRMMMAIVPNKLWGPSFGSTNLVGVWVEPVGDDATVVTVVSKRRDGGVYSMLPELQFHEELQIAVAILTRGDPLPSARP